VGIEILVTCYFAPSAFATCLSAVALAKEGYLALRAEHARCFSFYTLLLFGLLPEDESGAGPVGDSESSDILSTPLTHGPCFRSETR
jgi:hypothetical protein